MKTFEEYIAETEVYGVIKENRHPIVTIKGLPEVHPQEMIIFEDGRFGQVLDIDESEIRALLLSETTSPVGTKVTRTKNQIQVPVGTHVLGKIIDPLGIASEVETTSPVEYRDVFVQAPGIGDRVKIDTPFLTGVTKVDLLLPLGKGQRELVLGDVKTGKTTFLHSALRAQLQNPDTVCVYAAIGKRRSELTQLESLFSEAVVGNKLVIVASSASDAPTIHYLTPYVAMTHAEYFRDQGYHVVVVLDDLSTHAQSYREIALLSKRFPGRDSYPGDIFFAHASLLERAGNFKHPQKNSVSITCLPVASTVEGDMTGFISTNLMGMTDGHILFDTDIYNEGVRPAIDITLSVTRVGRQTQNDLGRSITRAILSVLSQYEKIKGISHLGSELTEESRTILKKGASLEQMLHQDQGIMPHEVQLVLFGLVWLDICDFSDQEVLKDMTAKLLTMYASDSGRTMLAQAVDAESLAKFLSQMKQQPFIPTLCKRSTS